MFYYDPRIVNSNPGPIKLSALSLKYDFLNLLCNIKVYSLKNGETWSKNCQNSYIKLTVCFCGNFNLIFGKHWN